MTKELSDKDWYDKGNEYRSRQDWKQAMECYMRAEKLNPNGPAKYARQMTEDIVAFYCRDYYNP